MKHNVGISGRSCLPKSSEMGLPLNILVCIQLTNEFLPKNQLECFFCSKRGGRNGEDKYALVEFFFFVKAETEDRFHFYKCHFLESLPSTASFYYITQDCRFLLLFLIYHRPDEAAGR